MLIGNKCDLDATALRNEAMEYAKENNSGISNCSVCFTSALTGEGIEACLQELAEKAVESKASETEKPPVTSDLETVTTKKKGKCCK
jgi:GTPase SAR1 family protein